MKRKGLVITVCLSLLLALASPFNVYADEYDNISTVSAYNFFYQMYGFTVHSDNIGTLRCSTTGDGQCTVYTNNISNVSIQNKFNFMFAPSSPFRYSEYNSTKRTRVSAEPLYIVFVSSANITDTQAIPYTESGYTTTLTRITNDTLTVLSGVQYFIVLKLTATTLHPRGYNWVTIDMPFVATSTVLPMYLGTEKLMPDDIHQAVFGYKLSQSVSDDTTHTLLNEGTNQSQTVSNQLGNKTSDLTSSINDVTSLEDDFITDMDSSIEDIDFNSSLVSNGNLLSSMTWVKQQYDRMTVNNVFGSMIQYALLFGLGLLIIGRFK